MQAIEDTVFIVVVKPPKMFCYSLIIAIKLAHNGWMFIYIIDFTGDNNPIEHVDVTDVFWHRLVSGDEQNSTADREDCASTGQSGRKAVVEMYPSGKCSQFDPARYLSGLEDYSFHHYKLVIFRGWCPPVISWFITPMNTIVMSAINHSEMGVTNQLS